MQGTQQRRLPAYLHALGHRPRSRLSMFIDHGSAIGHRAWTKHAWRMLSIFGDPFIDYAVIQIPAALGDDADGSGK